MRHHHHPIILLAGVILGASLCSAQNLTATQQDSPRNRQDSSASTAAGPASPAMIAALGKLAFVQQPTATAAGALVSPPVTIQLKDSKGANVAQSGVSILMTLSSGTGTLNGTTTQLTDASGLATFGDLSLTLIGAKKLTASNADYQPVTSGNFNITLGPPANLVIQTQPPASATAGVPFNPRPVLWVVDAGGNLVTTDNSTAVTASRLFGAGTLQGTLTATAVKGVVTFANLSHTIATTITILFTSGTLTPDTSTAVLIIPAAAAQLAFLQQPAPTFAGAIITPPVTVALMDAFGNGVTTSGTPVALAMTSGTGTLGGTLTRNTVGGVSTFNDLDIDLAGSKTLTATSGTLTSARSVPFTITSRGAQTVAFIQQPTNTVATALITPPITLQIRDSLGNSIAAAGLPVTLAISAGTGTLSGTTTQQTDTSGRATFSGLSINLAGIKTLSASAPGLTTATSTTFTISPGTGTALRFVQQPANASAGSSITPAATVQLSDAQGNSVPGAGISVSVTLSSGTGTLTGTVPQLTDGTGVATFSNLSINLAGTKRLTASAAGLTSAVSDSFHITAAPAARLAFTTSPGGGTAGVPFAVQPVVTLQDGFGNTVTGVPQTVTLAIQNDAGGGSTLSGTKILALNTFGGQAIFTGLSLNKAGTGFTLAATGSTVSTTPGSVQSAPFSITAATASKVRVETASNGTGGVLATQNVTSGTSITVYAIARDAFDNFTGNIAADQWTLTNRTGGVAATDLVASADRKSATFTGRLTGTAVISATAATLTPVPSGTLTVVNAGSPTMIRVETAANGTGVVVAPQTLTSGSSITAYAIERDAAGHFIANIAADGWTLQNKTGGVADGDLVASADRKSAKFTGKLNGSAQIRATSGTLTAVSSGILTVVAGAPATIAAGTGTPQSTQIGTPFTGRLGATVRDAAGNPARGAQVTWAPPPSGAGGSFGPGGNIATTDSLGGAASGVFTANTVAGSYTVTASVAGVASAASYALTNLVGAPGRITPVSGTPQSATVNSTFPQALTASVRDSSGNGVNGAIVTFTAPASGPGGTFSGGLRIVTVAAASGGVATSPSFAAGPFAGSYQVAATVAGVSTPALFNLTNTPGTIGSIVTTSGTPQSAAVGSTYSTRLAVQVRDASGNPVANAPVLFTAPPAGASGSFAHGITDSSRTDPGGIATASPLAANTVAGSFTVTASAPGVPSPATFLLTNTPGPVDTFLIDAEAGGPIGTQIAQVAFNIRIAANDQYGNRATQFNGTVDISSNGVLSQAGISSTPFAAGLLSSQAVALQGAGRFIIRAIRTGGAETGRTDTFQVVNPLPRISKLSPVSGTRGQTVSDTVTGWGFIPGVTTVSFGDKITTSTTVNSLTQMIVALTIDTAAVEGPRDVLAFNGLPGGGLGTLQAAFAVGSNLRPTLAAISPNRGGSLQRLAVDLSGSNFVSGPTHVSMGGGILVNALTVKSPQLMTADISITGSAAGGSRNIAVIIDPPGGGTSDSIAFTVDAPLTSYPVLNAPSDAATSLDTVLTFSWHPWLTAGITYRLQISANPAFVPTVFDDSAITDTVRQAASLARGVSYYWRVIAWNAVGSSDPSPARTFTTSAPYPAAYTLSDTVSFPVHSQKSDYQTTDYRLIGLPGDSRTLLGTVLGGTAKVDWVAYWDNGNPTDYLIPYDGSSVFAFTAGRAFWIIHKGPVLINRPVPTATLDSTRSVALQLHSGWNMISNPFLTSVPWSWVQYANGPAPIADPWSFDGSFARAVSLDPYKGYLFDNADNRAFIRIPFARSAAKRSANPGQWQIAITLASGTVIDRATSIGISPTAKAGRDPFDLRMPRGIGTAPGVYFSRPGWDAEGGVFASDIRPGIVSMESWPMDVRAAVGQPAQLSFDGVSEVPDCFRVMLIDDEHARAFDLRKESVYRFTPATPISRLRIVVGTEESVRGVLDDILPKDFALEKNFPNPFNPSTTITVDIPKASVVSLAIYTILGEEVQTLHSGPLEAGRHSFLWDGTARGGHPVSSGVYFVRLRTDAGKAFVGKMLLLK